MLYLNASCWGVSKVDSIKQQNPQKETQNSSSLYDLDNFMALAVTYISKDSASVEAHCPLYLHDYFKFLLQSSLLVWSSQHHDHNVFTVNFIPFKAINSHLKIERYFL